MSARGFALLEAMVALTVLGLVVVGYLQVFGASVRSTTRADEWVMGVAYAEAAMEVAKLDPRPTRDALPGGFVRQVATSPWRDGLVRLTVTITFPDNGRFTLERLVNPP